MSPGELCRGQTRKALVCCNVAFGLHPEIDQGQPDLPLKTALTYVGLLLTELLRAAHSFKSLCLVFSKYSVIFLELMKICKINESQSFIQESGLMK